MRFQVRSYQPAEFVRGVPGFRHADEGFLGINNAAACKRDEGNPILSAQDWPYPANAVFNPAAAKVDDQTLLLARVEDMRGFSHLTVARSSNGYTDWQIDPDPTFTADPNSQEERWGLEDPRIVWLEEQKQFAVTYVSFSEGGPLVSLAITKNFQTFARFGAM